MNEYRSMLQRLRDAVAKYDRIGFEGSDLLEVMSEARTLLRRPAPGDAGPFPLLGPAIDLTDKQILSH